jgi:hypothetical protein
MISGGILPQRCPNVALYLFMKDFNPEYCVKATSLARNRSRNRDQE